MPSLENKAFTKEELQKVFNNEKNCPRCGKKLNYYNYHIVGRDHFHYSGYEVACNCGFKIIFGDLPKNNPERKYLCE